MGARKFSLFDPTGTHGKLMRKIILLLIAVCLLGCKTGRQLPASARPFGPNVRVKSITKQIDLKLHTLFAHDIQENLTLRDELFVTYSLSVIDRDSVLKAAHGTRYLGKVKKGGRLNLDSLPSLHVALKEGQKLGLQIALWEIDDYSKSQIFLHKVNLFNGALQIPFSFVEWSSASNPIAWFLWGTRLSSIGLDFLASLDHDDLLGISETVYAWADLPLHNRSKIKQVQWKGKSSSVNSFHYEFTYEIKDKDIVK